MEDVGRWRMMEDRGRGKMEVGDGGRGKMEVEDGGRGKMEDGGRVDED